MMLYSCTDVATMGIKGNKDWWTVRIVPLLKYRKTIGIVEGR